MHYYETYFGYNDVCLILFLNGGVTQTEYWLLGDPLLRAYLTIYDRENNQIGFVGNTEAQPIEENYTMLIIVLCSVGVGVIVLIICTVIVIV